jgi:membrane-associated phospholipid phosphatase
MLLIINALNLYVNDLTVDVNLDTQDDPNRNDVVMDDEGDFVGTTLRGVSVDVWRVEQGVRTEELASEVSSDAGSFRLTVSLEPGLNTLEFVVKDPRGRESKTQRMIRLGDTLADWNATLLHLARESTSTLSTAPTVLIKPPPPMVAKNLAMVHIAMFDASNASEVAAMTTAANDVTTALFPETVFAGEIQATLRESLDRVPEGTAKSRGIEVGRLAAAAILAMRSNDGSNAASSYQPANEPGRWRPTAPGFGNATLPQWMNVVPFAMTTPNQFRPSSPPALTSSEYATAVEQVRLLGAKDGSTRTSDQTEIAKFWADGGGTATPPGHWNQIAMDVSLKEDQTELDRARTMALVNIALADAAIASWDAKYVYDLWRPIDAIQKGATDGNSATIEQSTWEPLLVTPSFPSYTSGHSTFSNAAAKVLTEVFGPNYSFSSFIDPGHTGQWPPDKDTSSLDERSFSSFNAAAQEAGMSRIYGGIHFIFDNLAGAQAGQSFGQLVSDTQLQPRSIGF